MKCSSSGKRLAFFGAVGYNLGDEAIAIAAAKYMLSIDPEIEICIGSLKRGTIGDRYENLKEFIVNRRSAAGWRELVRVIRSVDVVVLGGGTLVQDKLGISPLRGMIPYAFQITRLARIFGKPVVTLPIGVDELNTKLGRFLAGRLLNAVDHLAVRDSVSYRLASLYGGIKTSDINLGADPAYLIGDSVGEEEVWAIANKHTKYNLPSRYVAVSLVNESAVNERHLEALVDTFHCILGDTGLGLVFVPMDRREEEELRLFRSILERLDPKYHDRLRILSPDTNVFAVAGVIRGAELLIGMRLHAMILGVGHVPIVGISRTTKTDTLLDEFGLPHIKLERLLKAERLTLLVRELLSAKNYEQLRRSAEETRWERTERAMRGLEEFAVSVVELAKNPRVRRKGVA